MVKSVVKSFLPGILFWCAEFWLFRWCGNPRVKTFDLNIIPRGVDSVKCLMLKKAGQGALRLQYYYQPQGCPVSGHSSFSPRKPPRMARPCLRNEAFPKARVTFREKERHPRRPSRAARVDLRQAGGPILLKNFAFSRSNAL